MARSSRLTGAATDSARLPLPKHRGQASVARVRGRRGTATVFGLCPLSPHEAHVIRLLCALGALLILLVLGERALREHQRTMCAAPKGPCASWHPNRPQQSIRLRSTLPDAVGTTFGAETLGISQHTTAPLSSTAASSTCSRACSPPQRPSSQPSLETWPAYGLGPGGVRIHLLDQQGTSLA